MKSWRKTPEEARILKESSSRSLSESLEVDAESITCAELIHRGELETRHRPRSSTFELLKPK